MSETSLPQLPESNPFAAPWTLDLGLPDFAAVRTQDIEPAIRAGMAHQRAEWEAVATDPDEPTVANTVAALELSGDLLERALRVLYALTSATDSPELDKLEERLAPELAAHSDAYDLDPRLYRRFKALDELVSDARAAGRTPVDPAGEEIDEETARYIRLAVEAFERDGVALTGAEAERLREINAELTSLSTRVGTLIAKAMHEAGVANYTATPELAGLDSHAERVALLDKAMSRGLSGETDTRALILREVALRAERAQLLGFEHHAAIIAAESAAGTTQAVSDMLARLVPPAMANARRDADVYAARMAADPATVPGEGFGPADWPRYEEAERKERFGVDDAVLAPYLELGNVVENGVFYAANRLYGITFHERADLAAHMYDPDMRVWEVRDPAALSEAEREAGAEAPVLGLFVADYYARTGKQGGAWMDSLVDQGHLTGNKPVVINCLNLTKPDSGPTLLTWDNVITAFHEFGHALHGLFADTRWPGASGTNVPRDVVEFPSQVNESWALHPQVLASYARHVDTGEAMPAGLVEQLCSQGSFGQGYATTEYLGAALLDQAWHTLAPEQVPTDPEAVEGFEHEALAAVGIDDALVPPRYRTTYFNHVFAGGYSAAYYAYIWSEVMDADTTQWFRTDGEGARDGDLGLNREAGERFRREFLSRGDSRDPLVSFQAYRGRAPRLEPLLERRGLA
ncbi:M3 family metallopeptidase, partial [Actinomyces urogenitalis]|uniref:M3 family metallopeptidase n=1 Tax=Actinomyces urogenitalis TaxID=103621 RepID=UPI00242D81F3|nr:M3 family metallopeptidase [Actinomyces urogenitalis]MBS5976213.1 M3 family metallopeptidase [Actinomyces urogenitalis]